MRLPLALCAALLAGCASNPLKDASLWKIEQCIGAGNQSVRMNKTDGSAAATIPRRHCNAISAAGSKMASAAGHRLGQIYIASLDDPNAFATADKSGQSVVVVSLGMVNLLQDDEGAWAALIGHELSHRVRNHGAGRAEARQGAQDIGSAAGTILAQLIPGIGGFVAGNVASFTAANALYGAHTRPQEREADEDALRWMTTIGYDPRGAERLFAALAKSGGSGLPGFLSTHPGAEDRAEMVRAYIAGKR